MVDKPGASLTKKLIEREVDQCPLNIIPMKERCENHQKCMQMIQAVLDGSASAAEVEHFKLHMDDCLPCIEGYKLEKSIKDALLVKMEKKCCPQSTVVDIRAKVGLGLVILGFIVAELKLYHLLFNC